MNNIRLELLSEEHADVLFRFETDNRGTFEDESFSRHPSYYERNTFQEILEDLVEEQGQQLHAMYLVFNEEEELVGRVNLMKFVSEPFLKAEIGYLIDPTHQCKGYGTKAVRLLLEKAKNVYGLHRIESGTSPDNVAAQKVLMRNGFRHVGTYEQYIRVGEQWVDSSLYEKVLD